MNCTNAAAAFASRSYSLHRTAGYAGSRQVALKPLRGGLLDEVLGYVPAKPPPEDCSYPCCWLVNVHREPFIYI
jgi:hypothetical protein